mgnify:CR=1 FL=1
MMTEDYKREVREREIDKFKLEKSVSREFMELLLKVRRNATCLYADPTKEDTAFEDALRYVAALEHKLYPLELEKRQAIAGWLRRILDDAKEMQAMLTFLSETAGLEISGIAPTYERDRDISVELLNRLEAETTKTVAINWKYPFDAEIELHRFEYEARNGNIVERFVETDSESEDTAD